MKSRQYTWLGLALALAVAFNTLAPFFAFYNPSGNHAFTSSPVAASMKLASVFGEKILICTGDGFALVNIKDLQAGKVPIKPHKSYFCPLCYVAANPIGKMVLLALAFFFFTRNTSTTRPFLPPYAITLKSLLHTTSRPRAPPYSFC